MMVQILMTASLAADLGQTAPTLTLAAAGGEEVSLSQFKGKTVVLEWFNPGCPFVVYAYEDGPLKDMANKLGEEVVWLNINSGAPGYQGTGIEQNQKAKKTGRSSTQFCSIKPGKWDKPSVPKPRLSWWSSMLTGKSDTTEPSTMHPEASNRERAPTRVT